MNQPYRAAPVPQLSLFEPAPSAYPVGLQYQEDFLSVAEEKSLIPRLAALPLKEFEFRGYKGKRRVVSFGWHYDFNQGRLIKAEVIPSFLRDIAERSSSLGFDATRLQHILVTEYAPDAGIGWHKDRNIFDEVAGLSLGGGCVFRLRREAVHGWERLNLQMPARSAYLLSGPARWEWEHSIPPVIQLRYSITLRNFRKKSV